MGICNAALSHWKTDECEALEIPKNRNTYAEEDKRKITCSPVVRASDLVEFGQNVALFGSDKAIGEWKEGFPIAWAESDWNAQVRKLEEGNDRVFEVPSDRLFDIVCK